MNLRPPRSTPFPTRRSSDLILPRLPQGVQTELAKDYTSVGWVYEYALVDKSKKYSLADMKSFQDWYLRYALQSVPGVAEVAPMHGFVGQYQINVDPNKRMAYIITINRVIEAVKGTIKDFGARL